MNVCALLDAKALRANFSCRIFFGSYQGDILVGFALYYDDDADADDDDFYYYSFFLSAFLNRKG